MGIGLDLLSLSLSEEMVTATCPPGGKNVNTTTFTALGRYAGESGVTCFFSSSTSPPPLANVQPGAVTAQPFQDPLPAPPNTGTWTAVFNGITPTPTGATYSFVTKGHTTLSLWTVLDIKASSTGAANCATYVITPKPGQKAVTVEAVEFRGRDPLVGRGPHTPVSIMSPLPLTFTVGGPVTADANKVDVTFDGSAKAADITGAGDSKRWSASFTAEKEGNYTLHAVSYREKDEVEVKKDEVGVKFNIARTPSQAANALTSQETGIDRLLIAPQSEKASTVTVQHSPGVTDLFISRLTAIGTFSGEEKVEFSLGIPPEIDKYKVGVFAKLLTADANMNGTWVAQLDKDEPFDKDTAYVSFADGHTTLNRFCVPGVQVAKSIIDASVVFRFEAVAPDRDKSVTIEALGLTGTTPIVPPGNTPMSNVDIPKPVTITGMSPISFMVGGPLSDKATKVLVKLDDADADEILYEKNPKQWSAWFYDMPAGTYNLEVNPDIGSNASVIFIIE